MPIRTYCFRLFLLALLSLPLAASAVPRYKVTVLSGPGSVATDINNSGQVVGNFQNSSGGQRAFLHSGIGMLDLGSFNETDSYASAVNDNGQVVGYFGDGFSNRAFRYSGGAMADLGTLGGDYAAAYGINSAGFIVGGASTSDENQFGLPRAFVHAAGSMMNIGTLPNGDMSDAYAINSKGQVVGRSSISTDDPTEHPFHAFRFSNGVMTDLGTLGGLYSHATAINEGGVVVGFASTALDPWGIGHTVSHAFIFIDGMMIDLGALGGPEVESAAHDINNLGQVVGWSDTSSDRRAFLFDGSNMIDLNQLIDPSEGWLLQEARGINDMQQIAATGCREGECFALRLDLVTDVPEPGTYVLMLIGLGVMRGVARRRRR